MPELMTPNMRKSRLSISYIESVASHAGFWVDEPKADYDSIDGTLKADLAKDPA